MDINKFAAEAHKNAVEHGFWEEELDISEVIALIHSEWSEALEEYRTGRPMFWYGCKEADQETLVCSPKDEYDCLNFGKEESCAYRSKKPEGIVVELIDGCIRIFDYFGKEDVSYRTIRTLEQLMEVAPEETFKIPLTRLVANLHLKTAQAYQLIKTAQGNGTQYKRGIAILYEAISVACCWIRNNGYYPEAIMLKKHEYNKTRPYKHGKAL